MKSHLRPLDAVSGAFSALRSRRLRTTLTAVGIAIGIAALVAVLGISASSRADALAQLDRLGTNRLEVRPGQSFLGDAATLPERAKDMIARIGPVHEAAATTAVSASVRRNDLIPSAETGGISVLATEADLLPTTGATLAEGRFLDDATGRLPTVVLGATAAQRLGISDVSPHLAVWLGDQWFTVIGILDPVPLYPGLDSAALIGADVAEELFDTTRSPGSVYVTTDPDDVESVREVLAPTANPEAPNEVDVSRPSDALVARDTVDDSLTALLLGLGAVALLVGGIGIANVMVVAVLERRPEIGIRRALGATRGHIRIQFVLEAVLLALLGGVLGLALGAGVTAAYDAVRDITFDLPPVAVALGLGSALVVGALAGLSPAGRAARMAPADAVRPR